MFTAAAVTVSLMIAIGLGLGVYFSRMDGAEAQALGSNDRPDA